MKLSKGLILGSATALLAIGTAQAADLPVKAKAVEYVRICSAYGAGFWYIPGTDTCMKIGGYLRVDATFNGGAQGQPAWNGDLGQQNRYRDYYSARSRMALTVDTRTASEYGVVRTFMQADMQFTTLGNNTFNPSSLNTSVLNANVAAQYGGGVLANNAQLLDTPGGGYVAVESVFVQFAGFTFGKSVSAYSTPWNAFPGNISSFLLGGHDTTTGVNNIQYTAQFGNGVSGTVGLDDPVVFGRTAVYNLAAPLNTANTSFMAALGTQANSYAGVRAPDLVGNIRADQAWGLFQISGALHEVNGSYNALAVNGLPTGLGAPAPFGASEPSGHPDAKWGGAVMAAVNIKNIPTGAGDDIKVDATWSKGDTKNVISTSAVSPNFAMFSGSTRAGAYQSVGFGVSTDALWLPTFAGGDGNLHLTEAYGIRGAFNHNWDAHWSSSLFGSYSAVRYDSTAKANYCAVYTTSSSSGGLAGKSTDYTCNPDYNVSQLGLVTRWVPVKNLTFSAEVMWFHLDQKFTGVTTMTSVQPKPNVNGYEFKDQDVVSLQLRAQRNF
jgi:hypothetical protein